jgi:hypothetical protein
MDKIAMLENMKSRIEQMNKSHQIEILKILNKYPAVKLNENKSGIFVNLSFLPNDALDNMVQYLDYVKDQEQSLDTMENQKQNFKNTFFAENRISNLCRSVNI